MPRRQAGALNSVVIDGDSYFYAQGNSTRITGPWPDDATPRTGMIGHDQLD